MWKQAAKLIRRASAPVITTHVQPDGDAIGSEVALAEILRQLGAKPQVINADPAPPNYDFLCRRYEPKVYDPVRHRRYLRNSDLAILLDANGWERAGSIGEALPKLGVPTLCIDHHQPQKADFADVWIGVPSASSTCELIYDLAEQLGVEQNSRFAEAIYAGLLFDTGNFRFSNTNVRVHEIAANLIRAGISAEVMHRRVFESGNWQRMRLFAMAIQTLRPECGGKIAWFKVTRDMFRKSGASEDAVDGFVDWVRTIREAEMIMMFRHHRDGLVKASLRSKTNHINVELLARKFGGGGHRRAAGITIEGDLEDVAARVVREARKIYRDD